MRMKKYLILALTAAIAAVGCSKTFEVVPTPTDSNPIGFGTWANTLTKASHATGNVFNDGEAFDVYGNKTVSSSPVVVFDGDDVTYTSSTAKWDYTTKRFWDPTATQYTFFAVLPAGNLANEASAGAYATGGLFTSNDITFSDPTSYTNDILVADKTVVTPTGSAGSYVYTNPVQMDFNHAASRVDFKVKQDAALGASAVVTVTDLSLINIHNKGHFTVSAYANSAPYKPTVGWDEAQTPTTLGTEGVYSILSSVSIDAGGQTVYDTDADPDADNDVSGSAVALFTDYVFMPQTITTAVQKLRISYTITIGNEVSTFTNKEFDLYDFMTTDSNDNSEGSHIAAWAPNTHYTYYLTIGANAISFTATIENWEASTSGYQYLLK